MIIKYMVGGMNSKYQLGIGHNQNVLIPQELKIEDVKEIYPAGQATIFIIKNDNTIWGRGQNENGSLGQGNFQEIYEDFVKLDKCIYYEK